MDGFVKVVKEVRAWGVGMGVLLNEGVFVEGMLG